MKTLSEKGKQTRQSILMSAFELFHASGIHAVTIDDILKESGTGKSQFYYHFSNKDDLIHALLQHAHGMIRDGNTHLQPIHSWKEFKDWLHAMIDKHESHQCQRACPIGQIVGQLSEEDELFRQDMRLIFDAITDFPRDFFVSLKARNELRDGADPDAMASFCVAAMQGAGLFSKLDRNTERLQQCADYLYDMMQSLQAKH